MGMYGYIWVFIGMYGYIWVCMGMYGYIQVYRYCQVEFNASKRLSFGAGSLNPDPSACWKQLFIQFHLLNYIVFLKVSTYKRIQS